MLQTDQSEVHVRKLYFSQWGDSIQSHQQEKDQMGTYQILLEVLLQNIPSLVLS